MTGAYALGQYALGEALSGTAPDAMDDEFELGTLDAKWAEFPVRR